MFELDWVFNEVSSGIKALIETFTEVPYFLYSEQDMHAYLYHKLKETASQQADHTKTYE